MNSISNRFQIDELEQRLEMGKWSASAGGTVSSDGTYTIEAKVTYSF